jgi:2-polyprenyl-3-methyl-5-hydroxy-6-metoxy-1,4-benzoquinol methylase
MNPIVNTYNARQDINRQREFDPTRVRYSFAARLLPETGHGKSFVDVGGGAGEFCALARNRGFKSTLIDGNKNSVEAERSRGGAAVLADLTCGVPEVPSESYDAGSCLEVIEHIVTAEQLLHECCRIIKQNGIFIISTPNFAFLADRVDYLLGRNVREEGYHFRFFTVDSLERMIENTGFVIETRCSVGSAIGVNRALRVLTFGRLRINHFACPIRWERLFSPTLIWRLRRRR